MTLRPTLFTAFFIALLMGFSAAPAPSIAHEYETGSLSIYHPYAYEVKLKGEATNAYMTINNEGAEGDVLLRATSPIAASIDIVNEEEKMDKLEIGSRSSVKFKMHGIHLRLNGVKKTIKPGTRQPITLVFEHAGEVKAQLIFTKLGEISLCDDGSHNKTIGADKRN